MPDHTIEAVIEKYRDAMMALPGVVGIAVGEYSGSPCIKVFVVRRTEQLIDRIPSALEGYPVVVQETGEFVAF